VTLTYGYDGPIDTLETWSGSVAGSVSVALDREFRVSSQRVNGANTVVYQYDQDGLLTHAGDLAVARRTDNGLISGTTLGGVTTEESYSSVGELWKRRVRYGGNTLYEATYGRDSLGRITSITEVIQGGVPKTTTYGYGNPDTGFVASVVTDGVLTERYRYDANGNRLATASDTATATYDDQDRLLRYGSTSYTYTPAGELASATTNGAVTRYVYDALGNLLKVRFPSGDSLEYLVDGRNRRVGRKWNGSVTHRWLYQDQLEPVAELDGAGNLVARYVYGTRSNVPDYMVKGEVTYRIVSDHLGSVRLVVNVQSGAVVQRMRYDTSGRLLEDANQGLQCFGYAGGPYETTAGFMRFGARDYDPLVGRWTSKDPIRFHGGDPNLYAYAGNCPHYISDPTGRAYKGYRPPRGWPAAFPFPLDDWLNTELLHEAIVYEDAPDDNASYYGDEGEGRPGNVRPDYRGHCKYRRRGPHYDDKRMRKAVENVAPRWHRSPFHLIGHNCQGFVDAVLAEYYRLSETR
jgi:RHS repeat-associated protein